MFGDKPIYGVKTSKLDSKGRFFMPSFTSAEPHDEIGISIFDSNQLRLYNLMKITDEIKRLKETCITEKDEKTITQIQCEIELILNSIRSTSSIDSQHRLLIPKDIINAGDYGEFVTIQGAYDHARVFNSEESYQDYSSRFLSK